MTGIARKVKEKVKDAKDKVVGIAEKATNTTKKASLPLPITKRVQQRILLKNMTKGTNVSS
jgi:hypothetical protein